MRANFKTISVAVYAFFIVLLCFGFSSIRGRLLRKSVLSLLLLRRLFVDVHFCRPFSAIWYELVGTVRVVSLM